MGISGVFLSPSNPAEHRALLPAVWVQGRGKRASSSFRKHFPASQHPLTCLVPTEGTLRGGGRAERVSGLTLLRALLTASPSSPLAKGGGRQDGGRGGRVRGEP